MGKARMAKRVYRGNSMAPIAGLGCPKPDFMWMVVVKSEAKVANLLWFSALF
jgi:hypothetical protein